MDDSLRTDAEYVRDHDGYEFPSGPQADREFIERAKRLADAYLAENAPGDSGRWECMVCARVFDATADDYCPTCGAPAPPLE